MIRRLAALALVAFALLAAPATAQTPAAPPAATTIQPAPAAADPDRARIEAIIRDYILRNPEIVQEAIAELERRQQVAEERARTTALQANREAIYRGQGQIVLGNPQGDVTLVEFFDYNCGFCKRAMGDINELLRSDPRLRVVLRDFPVLGPSSVEAAQVALAVQMQLSGQRYLDFHQRLLSSRGQIARPRALEAAREVGVDMARLERDMNNPAIRARLSDTARIAQALRIDGTPTYLVGDEIVVGAVGLQRLRESITLARDACRQPGQVC